MKEAPKGRPSRKAQLEKPTLRNSEAAIVYADRLCEQASEASMAGEPWKALIEAALGQYQKAEELGCGSPELTKKIIACLVALKRDREADGYRRGNQAALVQLDETSKAVHRIVQ